MIDSIKDIHAFRKDPPPAGPAPEIRFREEQRLLLENGMKVILIENHKLPRVNAQLFIDHGIALQGPKAGLNEITGQLLSCGTIMNSKSEWDRKVDYYGATVHTSSIGGYVSSLSKHFDAVFSLFAEAIMYPAFPVGEFENIRRQQLSNLAAQKDEAESILSNIVKIRVYPEGHPYHEVVTESSVSCIGLEDCRRWYDANFMPNRSYLILEGNISLEEVKTLVDGTFARWQKKDFAEPQFDRSIVREMTDISFSPKEGSVQSLIGVSFAVDYLPYNEDMIAANLMNSVLGGYFSSRLNRNLREDKGFTYGISSRLSQDEHMGSFFTSVNVRNEVTSEAIGEIIKEIRRLREEIIPADELQQVKNVVSGNFSRSVEDPRTIARFALARWKFGLPDDYFKNQLIRIHSVTAEEIRSMAKKYLLADNLHLFVVGNEAVLPQLSRFGKIYRYDYEGKPQN